MFLAKNMQGRCISSQLAKKEEPYFCLECEQVVALRQSKVGRPYFAHLRIHRKGGEGHEHKLIKHHLESLEETLCFEQKIGHCRADVMYGKEVIEIQVSMIQQQQIQLRQQNYRSRLHWLLGPNWQRPEQAWQCLDRFGKVYRYHPEYCECYCNFHPLTKQRGVAIKRIICWDVFFLELTKSHSNCLSYQQFVKGASYLLKWRQTYSFRSAKVQDEIAQVLYRWGMRSEQLPEYVGIPIPIVMSELNQVLPVIWQGECCYRLANGEYLLCSDLSWSQQFYLDILVRLGVCQKKADRYQTYQRQVPTMEQLYQAYRLTWQAKPWPA